MRTALLTIVLLATGCERSQPVDRAGKLELVRSAAQKLASPDDLYDFENASAIGSCSKFPLNVVGLRVPLKNHPNSIFVTFEVEHFDGASVEQLAKEAVEDFNREKNGGRSGG